MYLLDLALEIFRKIVSYAIPQEASDLEAFTSQPLIPRKSTKPLQLVNRAFHDEVITQLYIIRPLNIRVYDEQLLLDLIEGREPCLLSLIEYMEAARVRNNKHSLASLRKVPLHRFRRIDIHLIPLMAPLNSSRELQFPYFRREDFEHIIDHEEDRYELEVLYEEILEAQADIILNQARSIALALQEIEDIYLSISSRRTTFRVFMHDDPNKSIPTSYLPNDFLIPRAPIGQLIFQPRPTENDFTTALLKTSPYIPIWDLASAASIRDVYAPLITLAFPSLETTQALSHTLSYPNSLRLYDPEPSVYVNTHPEPIPVLAQTDFELSSLLIGLENILINALTSADFAEGVLEHPTHTPSGDFEIEQRAMIQVAKEWRMELLTKAVREDELAGVYERTEEWKDCMRDCERRAGRKWCWRGFRWEEGGEWRVTVGDEEHKEDVGDVSGEIRGVIGRFMGREFDEGDVRWRMALEEKRREMAVSNRRVGLYREIIEEVDEHIIGLRGG